MFLNTYDLGEWAVCNWKIKQDGHISLPKDRKPRGKRYVDIDERKSLLVSFFNRLIKVPSHFCRATSTKLFLEPLWSTKKELYCTYEKELLEGNEPLSKWVFDAVFESMNLSLFTRKKDLCDTCIAFEKKFITKERYDEHIRQKNLSRAEKEKDKNGPFRVFQFDKQATFMAPKNNACITKPN